MNEIKYKGNYKCICGREFINSQAFNGHKSHCKEHQFEKYGNLDKKYESIEKRLNNKKNNNKLAQNFKVNVNKKKRYYLDFFIEKNNKN